MTPELLEVLKEELKRVTTWNMQTTLAAAMQMKLQNTIVRLSVDAVVVLTINSNTKVWNTLSVVTTDTNYEQHRTF